jgi:hypothetical protein
VLVSPYEHRYGLKQGTYLFVLQGLGRGKFSSDEIERCLMRATSATTPIWDIQDSIKGSCAFSHGQAWKRRLQISFVNVHPSGLLQPLPSLAIHHHGLRRTYTNCLMDPTSFWWTWISTSTSSLSNTRSTEAPANSHTHRHIWWAYRMLNLHSNSFALSLVHPVFHISAEGLPAKLQSNVCWLAQVTSVVFSLHWFIDAWMPDQKRERGNARGSDVMDWYS